MKPAPLGNDESRLTNLWNEKGRMKKGDLWKSLPARSVILLATVLSIDSNRQLDIRQSSFVIPSGNTYLLAPVS